jgi:hypothetical protein
MDPFPRSTAVTAIPWKTPMEEVGRCVEVAANSVLE